MTPELQQAKDLVLEHQKASPSLLMRKMHINYNEAAELIQQLEMNGVIGPFKGSKPRKILHN